MRCLYYLILNFIFAFITILNILFEILMSYVQICIGTYFVHSPTYRTIHYKKRNNK